MAPQYGPPGPPPYQPGPPYGPPQQPGKPFSKNVQYLLIGAGVLIAVIVLAVVVVSTLAGSNDRPAAKPSPKAPAGVPGYKVISEKKRTIVVEVATTKDLRAVFDAVRSKHRADGGYFVSINCSTGGAARADNRLANGKFAVGQLGAAQTGLEAGKSELEINADRRCPA